MTTDQPQSRKVQLRQPHRLYKRQQARISRRVLYPVTAFYTLFSALMLLLAFRTKHLYVALAFYFAGLPVWTLVEYLTHRYILHRHFQRSKKRYKVHKTFANKYLDPLHWGHHKRPFDGNHINGRLRDLMPLFVVSAAGGYFLFPLYTALMLLAGVCQCYVIEEWVHHSVHYYNFRDPYFRYIKKHHFYHHTSEGMTKGFGFTSAIWDVVFNTRFPEAVRYRLYRRGKPLALAQSGSTSASASSQRAAVG